MGSRSLFGAAVAGAVLAAAIVGVGEAAVVAFDRGLGLDPGLLFFALVFYGLAGAAVGMVVGVGLTLLAGALGARMTAPGAFALTGGLTLSGLATTIGRFRVFRDVFHETL